MSNQGDASRTGDGAATRAPDPQHEAFLRLGGRAAVRVLEPSPPAVAEGPWFADDPVAGGQLVPVDRPNSTSWADHCASRDDPGLASWCAERWLGPWPRLERLPERFVTTRRALHAVAEHVLAPARHVATGKIGLRFTRGGFGTPYFGDDRQVRVAGVELVDGDTAVALTTLRAACETAGVEPGRETGVFTPTTPPDLDAPLDIDAEAAAALGQWYGFCASVLEQLRSESPDASRVQLWPEHFDLAVDLGDDAAGQRANYGGSPGDDAHSEPYLYVGPWSSREGPFWNEPFGASLGYHRLLEATNQRDLALEFLRTRRQLLHSPIPMPRS